MTKLLWDQPGDRFYETGIDRGVLYLSDGSGVPWNGLTGLEEQFDDNSEPRYLDGVKSLDVPSFGDYAASLKAFTYPDEFLEYEGISYLGPGLYVDSQSQKTFGLSYRTIVGNDTEGMERGYKVHIVYNLTAAPESVSNESISDSPAPIEFSWNVTGVPSSVESYRPTGHVIFDSRLLPSSLLQGLEGILYGDDDNEARLPTINELIGVVTNWDPKLIVPESVTGLSNLIAGVGDLTQSIVEGIYTSLPTTRLVESESEGLYHLDI